MRIECVDLIWINNSFGVVLDTPCQPLLLTDNTKTNHTNDKLKRSQRREHLRTRTLSAFFQSSGTMSACVPDFRVRCPCTCPLISACHTALHLIFRSSFPRAAELFGTTQVHEHFPALRQHEESITRGINDRGREDDVLVSSGVFAPHFWIDPATSTRQHRADTEKVPSEPRREDEDMNGIGGKSKG